VGDIIVSLFHTSCVHRFSAEFSQLSDVISFIIITFWKFVPSFLRITQEVWCLSKPNFSNLQLDNQPFFRTISGIHDDIL
jgi:hypothetical protein